MCRSQHCITHMYIHRTLSLPLPRPPPLRFIQPRRKCLLFSIILPSKRRSIRFVTSTRNQQYSRSLVPNKPESWQTRRILEFDQQVQTYLYSCSWARIYKRVYIPLPPFFLPFLFYNDIGELYIIWSPTYILSYLPPSLPLLLLIDKYI